MTRTVIFMANSLRKFIDKNVYRVYRSIGVHVRVREPWGRLRLTRECLSFDLFVSQSALFYRPFWSFDNDEAFVPNYHTHHVDGFVIMKGIPRD